MSGRVQKSFITMGLSLILDNVLTAVIEAEKKARASKEIQTLDVLRPGLRQDIYIGKLLVIPPAIMDSADKVPLPFFRGALLNLFNAEDASEYEQFRLAESEFDQLKDSDFKLFKDTVFKDETGNYRCVVMFLPAWSNPRDYNGFKFDKNVEKLEQLIRHLVFGSYYDPSLSSLFDTLEGDASFLDVKNIQHDHTGPSFALLSEENVYPVLDRAKGIPALNKNASKKPQAPFIRFAKDQVAAIKAEVLTPEENAVVDELIDDITKKIAVVTKCQNCGAETKNGELLCDNCKPKQKTSDDVETIAISLLATVKASIADLYFSSDEDQMSLIESIDGDNLDEATDEAIYKSMSSAGVPYDLSGDVESRVKVLLDGETQNSTDLNIDLMGGEIPEEVQDELDVFDGVEANEPTPNSIRDFYTKCFGCGAVTEITPETPIVLVMCPSCEGKSIKTASGSEDSTLLARSIYWKCFEGKKSSTMTQIKECVGSNFTEIQQAMMELWKKNLVTPSDKFNTWLTVGDKTEKNTFNGKWPWNVHQASEKRGGLKTNPTEYVDPKRNDMPSQSKGLEGRPDYGKKDPKFPTFKGDERGVAKSPKKMGGVKSSRGSLLLKRAEQDKFVILMTTEDSSGFVILDNSSSVVDLTTNVHEATVFNGERETDEVLGTLFSPSNDLEAIPLMDGELAYDPGLAPPTDKEWLKGIGIQGKLKDKFIIMSLDDKYLVLTSDMANWTNELKNATRFMDEHEADEAAFEYGGEVFPDMAEEKKKDTNWLKGIGIQGAKKKAITFFHPGNVADAVGVEEDETIDTGEFKDKPKAPDIKIGRKKFAFDWTAPGQVLKEFFPGMHNELQTNMHDKDDYHPVMPDEQERESGSNEKITLKDNEASEKHSLTSPGLVSTEEGGGTPLRSRERNIRGPFFADQFYKIHADIAPAYLTIKSSLAQKKATNTENVEVVEKYLTSVAAEIASTILTGSLLSPVTPSFLGVSTKGSIRLLQEEKDTPVLGHPLVYTEAIFNQVKALMSSLNDNDLVTAINNSWAQSAVWKEDNGTGFLYEVFVRIESIDIDNLKIDYKFLANKKEK